MVDVNLLSREAWSAEVIALENERAALYAARPGSYEMWALSEKRGAQYDAYKRNLDNKYAQPRIDFVTSGKQARLDALKNSAPAREAARQLAASRDGNGLESIVQNVVEVAADVGTAIVVGTFAAAIVGAVGAGVSGESAAAGETITAGSTTSSGVVAGGGETITAGAGAGAGTGATTAATTGTTTSTLGGYVKTAAGYLETANEVVAVVGVVNSLTAKKPDAPANTLVGTNIPAPEVLSAEAQAAQAAQAAQTAKAASNKKDLLFLFVPILAAVFLKVI